MSRNSNNKFNTVFTKISGLRVFVLFTLIGVVWGAGFLYTQAAGRFDSIRYRGDSYAPTCSRVCQAAEGRRKAWAQKVSNAKQALHLVFAEEEKQFPGIGKILDDEAGAPLKRALADWETLKTKNSKAKPVDLASQLRKSKQVFAKDTGIGAWMSTYQQAKVDLVSPVEGPSGTLVKIVGENLGNATAVKFGAAKASPRVVDSKTLEVTVPEYVNQPQFKVEVLTPYGDVKSPNDFFWWNGQCSDFRIARAIFEMENRFAKGTANRGECDTSLYGGFTSFEQLIVFLGDKGRYMTRAAPQVSYITPESGSPGAKVQITGTNLYQLRGITFNGKPAQFTSGSDLYATAVVPEGGSGKVVVTTYSGSKEAPVGFEIPGKAPTVEGVSGNELMLNGIIKIRGANFGPAPKVTFTTGGGYEIIGSSDTEITVKFTKARVKDGFEVRNKAGAGKWYGNPITVWSGQCRDPWIAKAFEELLLRKPMGQDDLGECNYKDYRNGQWANYEELKFGIRQRKGYAQKPPPTISKITPSPGLADKDIVINGTGFTEIQGVILGNQAASSAKLDHLGRLIVGKLPLISGSIDVTVSTLYGSGTFKNFPVIRAPVISNVDPKSGLAGADVVIRGQGLEQVDKIYFGGKEAKFERKEKSLTAYVPQGLESKKYVDISVTSDIGDSSWGKFAIAKAQLILPKDAKSLKDVRVELIAPDGKILSSTPLIGNAGAGMTNDQIAKLIGNAGAGLIGNAGSALAGNAGSSLIGNAGSALAGNAGATLAGNFGSGLIGNAGAGWTVQSIAKLIGNAGAGLNGAGIYSLIGNAGAALTGNVGAALIGNAGSALAGNAGATLAGNFGSGLAGNYGVGLNVSTGNMMMLSSGTNVASRSVNTFGSYSAQRIRPADDTQEGVAVPSQKTTTAAPQALPLQPPVKEPTKPVAQPETKPVSQPLTPPPANAPAQPPQQTPPLQPVKQPTKPVAQPETKPVSQPSVSPGTSTPVQLPTQTPVPSPSIVAAPEPAQSVINCSVGFSYSPTLKTCVEDAPAETSPYKGLPCNPQIPLYQQKGCIE